VIDELDPIAPSAIGKMSEEELEDYLFDRIINAPGAPQWAKEANQDNASLKELKKSPKLRRVFNDLIKEYNIVKAAGKCKLQEDSVCSKQ
jgi:hypothetical protein